MSIPDIYNAPRIVVTIEIRADQAVVRNQAYNATRTIPLGGNETPADPAGLFGTVRGRIENDALAIESRDYPASAWGLGAATQIMGAGADVPSSERKTVTERFSVSGDDGLTLVYEYTVNDPAYLTEPFRHRIEMARLPTMRRSIRSTATSRAPRSSRATEGAERVEHRSRIQRCTRASSRCGHQPRDRRAIGDLLVGVEHPLRAGRRWWPAAAVSTDPSPSVSTNRGMSRIGLAPPAWPP